MDAVLNIQESQILGQQLRLVLRGLGRRGYSLWPLVHKANNLEIVKILVLELLGKKLFHVVHLEAEAKVARAGFCEG